MMQMVKTTIEWILIVPLLVMVTGVADGGRDYGSGGGYHDRVSADDYANASGCTDYN